MMNLSLHFDKGTILLKGVEDENLLYLDGVVWDERTNSYRAPALKYRDIVSTLIEKKISFKDHARKFSIENYSIKKAIQPRSFQKEALDTWIVEKRGVVTMPTGSGKTILALMLISKISRPTLIHVPTIDLM